MKESVLLWGNGRVLKENIFGLKTMYNVVGITGENVRENDAKNDLFAETDAIKLKFDKIIITSTLYHAEIKQKLVQQYNILPSRIEYIMDEFQESRRASFGIKNKDVTIYIGRLPHFCEKCGFMGIFIWGVHLYQYCSEKGYELVIDTKNYYSLYGGDRYGRVNMWEDYFLQPSKYTLDEAYESQNVILGGLDDREKKIFPEQSPSIESVVHLSKLFGNRFIQSEILKEKVSLEQSRISRNTSGRKILGVIARGTDYIYLKLKNHFIPCTTSQYIEYVKKYMMQFGYQYIYLATEDLDIYNQFVEAFPPEYLLSSDQRRVSMSENDKMALMQVKLYDKDDGYVRGMEYNVIISMLANCDGLISNCMCGAAWGALFLNAGKYGHVKIMDQGKYD